MLRVKSKLCHRQGRNTFFFDDQAFQLLTVQNFTFLVVDCANFTFQFLTVQHFTKLTCKSESCHRQGRDTLAVWSVCTMGMLQKVPKMERLKTCFSSVSKILNEISENLPRISLEDVDSILDRYCYNFQL